MQQPRHQLKINTLLLLLIIALISSNSYAGRWLTTDWVVECIDPVNCEPANEVLASQLKKGSVWLKGLGFEGPASFSNLELGEPELTHWIANISDEKVSQLGVDFTGRYDTDEELIWLTSNHYFNVGASGSTHDDPYYKLDNLKTVVGVHELFHAVQNASEYHLPFDEKHRWIREGTAVAVQLDYAIEIETDTDALYMRGNHTRPLDQPFELMDNYLTAGFWIFVGNQLGARPRTVYLHEMFQNELLAKDTGIAGVDDFLKPHGGMYKIFPLYMAKIDFDISFGEPSQWQLKLPPNQKEISKNFNGSVQQIAATASMLTVAHQSELPVEVRIEFVGNDSDLHLIVDKTLQLNQQQPQRNVFVQQVNENMESFEVVVAEVAKDVKLSKNRDFTMKVTLRELQPLPCGFKAEVGSGVPMAGYHEGPARMIGNLMVLSDPKTGWEAHVEIPAKTTGTFKTTFEAVAIKVDRPECPGGCVEYWESDDAQIQITAIDNDRKSGFVEGSFSGIASWKGGGSTGNATPFSVKVDKFRALKYSVRKKGALQTCNNYWKNR
ncbi:MAG: hypothetical protein R3F25_11230 [Gammaproteobacteria bacterium]